MSDEINIRKYNKREMFETMLVFTSGIIMVIGYYVPTTPYLRTLIYGIGGLGLIYVFSK